MMSFSFSGGVEVLGFISPTDITDEYPVIDPLYGIDGFRNVNTQSDLNAIPNLRRRAGMVVGVNNGSTYYKLNPGPWNGTITDWSLFQTGGGFTGGTVSGATIFTGGITANTLNVNGVNITGDTYTTGGTYSNGIIDFQFNTGGGYQVVGLYTGQTSYVNSLTTGTGLSADTTTGNVTIINTDPDQVVTISGGTGILTGGTYPNFIIENSLPDQTVVLNNGSNINVTGTYPNFTIDVTGLTDNDIYVTGFTYNDNTFTISDNSGSTFNTTINTVTGITVNGDLNVTGDASLQGVTATTLSINGVNITGDTYITGGTYFTGGTLELTNNGGNQIQITGLTQDLNNEIAGLAEADELTITLNTNTNKIELKEIVGPPTGGTRTFQGNIEIDGDLSVTGDTVLNGMSATTAFITTTQWTLDFMDSLDIDIYAPNNLSIDSKNDLVGLPTITILVNGLPYTYTTPINISDLIFVVSDVNSVIQFNITNYL